MNNTLLVLTDKYPYGLGETFIETERRNWSVFDKVIICPVLVNNTDTIRSDFQCCDYETLINTMESRTRILQIVKGLSGSICFTDFIKEVKQNFRFQNIRNAFAMFVRTNLRYKRIFKKLQNHICKDDRLLIYSYWMYEPALAGLGFKKICNKNRLITRAHGYDLYEERHKNCYVPYRKLVLNAADAIYPISDNGKKYLDDRYSGQFNYKIFVERLGTVKLFKESTRNNKEGYHILVTCSNMIPLKRIDKLIEALKQCSEKIVWYHFGDGELMARTIDLATTLPKNIQANFMGRVPNKEVQKFYANNCVDVFVNVSESEGVPVSIMEAQSYGIAVIATDVGGTSELVHDGMNGVLLNKDFTNEDLIAAMQNIVAYRDKYHANAIKTWVERSDANLIYNAFFMKERSYLESLS